MAAGYRTDDLQMSGLQGRQAGRAPAGSSPAYRRPVIVGPDDATVLRREVERNWSDLLITRRMLGVDLVGSSRI